MLNIKNLRGLFLGLFILSSFSMNAGAKVISDLGQRMNTPGGLVGSYQLDRGVNVNGAHYSCPVSNLELITKDLDSSNPVLTLVDRDKCPDATNTKECTVSTLRIRNQKSTNKGLNILSLDPDQVIYHATPQEVSEQSSDLTTVANLSVSYQKVTLKKVGSLEELEYRLQGSKGGPQLSCIYKRVVSQPPNVPEAKAIEASVQSVP